MRAYTGALSRSRYSNRLAEEAEDIGGADYSGAGPAAPCPRRGALRWQKDTWCRLRFDDLLYGTGIPRDEALLYAPGPLDALAEAAATG